MADQMLAAKEPLAAYSWRAAANLDFLPDGNGLNIAYEALDRHVTVSADGVDRSATALRWLGKKGERCDFTYNSLTARTNQFANVLADLGVQKGDRVFTLLGRVPDLYVAILGSLKYGAVVCPMFSAFGPDPIYQRLTRGNAQCS
jgi:acetyl-CoA synthetase